MYSVPILLIIWKRPQKILSLINALRKVKPSEIYISCDGPISTDSNNIALVEATKQIVSTEINWNCTISFNYLKENLGCKNGVIAGISWFFSKVEYGLILEDDCIPAEAFFQFTAELLPYYKNDMRIWTISGSNFQNGVIRGDGSYYFSRIPLIWGWATWRSRWILYDKNIQKLSTFKKTYLSRSIFNCSSEANYWFNSWRSIQNGTLDTWDYQWVFTCLINSGLSIIPNYNLVENIGFDSEATHTKVSRYTKKAEDIFFPISHPSFTIVDTTADLYQFKTHYQPKPIFLDILLLRYMLNKFSRDPTYYLLRFLGIIFK